MIRGTIELDFGPLDSLTGKAQNSGIMGAVRRAINRSLKPVRQDIIGNAEKLKRYGFLAKSIGNKVKLYPKNKAFVAVVGPKSKFKRKGPKRKRKPSKLDPLRDKAFGVKKRVFKLFGKKVRRKPRKTDRPDIYPSRYAWLLEKGTKRSKAKPFIEPAHDRHHEQFAATVVAEIQKEIAAASAKLKK